MKSFRRIQRAQSSLRKITWLVLLSVVAGTPMQTQAGANVELWDTSSRLPDRLNVENRTGWKPVPSDLLKLEADPPKASSDPGYYGKEYVFSGDAVVENRSLAAVFWSARGRVAFYSKNTPALAGDGSRETSGLGKKLFEFVPLEAKTRRSSITHCEIVRNSSDEVALDVSFSAAGSAGVSAQFVFGKSEIVEIKPAREMKGVTLFSSLDYGVAPSFIGDDLILAPAEYPSANTLSLAAEHLFLGLLSGEDHELAMTWPKGKQQVRLQLSDQASGKRFIEAIDFSHDGQSLYVAVLSAPGIWHKEALAPSYLEKDVAIQWKKPFPAKWKTQLLEAGVKTTFAFRESKGQVWRGVPGSYGYPVWFDGAKTLFHLGKKVPPKGESLIYFLEGQDTPVSFSTPIDIMKATLGRAMCDPILDIAGRKLRTHHRPDGVGVHRACTCGYTDAIQAVFGAGEEVARKDYIQGALDDMVYFVQRHVERIDEYRQFADEMITFLQAKSRTFPELKTYLEPLEQIARQIPQEYDVQKENMKSLEHAGELVRQTMALTKKKEANNLKVYMELLQAWRAMGGAQDYVVAQCHTIARKLHQEAGYNCVTQDKAVELAKEIRARCRQTLRNPDGYEIWADY